MKGTLQKKEQGWVVRYFDSEKVYDIMYCGEWVPLHQETFDPTTKQPIIPLVDGKKVEFEIEDFWETGLEQVYKVAILTNVDNTIALSQSDAKILAEGLINPPEPNENLKRAAKQAPYVSDDFQIGPDGAYEHKESEKITWDELFMDLEAKLDVYVPLRAINYIKNTYKKPKRKK
jgi:hypothetical protein